MPSLNKVMIIGNITRDPELKYTPKGIAIADISLAVNRTYSTADGEKREEVTFLEVTFFGKQAEVLAEYCRKGHPLYVDARLRMDSWDDKESGKKQYRLKLTGEGFQFLAQKDKGQGQGEERAGYPSQRYGENQKPLAQQMDDQARQAQRSAAPPIHTDLNGDEIPF